MTFSLSPSGSREFKKSSGRPPKTRTRDGEKRVTTRGRQRVTNSPSSSLLKDRLVVSSFRFLLKSIHRLLSFFLMFLISCRSTVKNNHNTDRNQFRRTETHSSSIRIHHSNDIMSSFLVRNQKHDRWISVCEHTAAGENIQSTRPLSITGPFKEKRNQSAFPEEHSCHIGNLREFFFPLRIPYLTEF